MLGSDATGRQAARQAVVLGAVAISVRLAMHHGHPLNEPRPAILTCILAADNIMQPTKLT